MQETAHFSVDTRLAALLGETYRSTEAALKELVDNAWDADADNVWITLPKPLTEEPIVVRDDGAGMSTVEVRSEYLAIARDPRSRRGEKSPRYKRRIKGRKGIGKFAGLAAARLMTVVTVAHGKRTTLGIDKELLLAARDDLEKVPLSLTVDDAGPGERGTTVTLRSLNQNLSFPHEEPMRSALVHEYGRTEGFTVYVNGEPLTIDDVPGASHAEQRQLSAAGDVSLKFTIAQGNKTPKYPGIVLKVGGKVVGRPTFFGLDDNEQIPQKLLKRIYGEVEVNALEDQVTADWGAILENSKGLQEVKAWVHGRAYEALNATYKRDMDLQKARLQRQIIQRLQKLPEHRRAFAEAAIFRVLQKFYGEREDRIDIIASVMLDAMERDEYWAVLQKINEARHADVASFAAALEQFGLLELALIAERARHRMRYLDHLDALAANPATVEKDIHKAIENSLWVLGTRYAAMASNTTLKRVVAEYCDKTYTGERAAKRPDLLLAADAGDRYLLIEFKRPSHVVRREDEAQARVYRDELSSYVPRRAIDIMVIGGARDKSMDSRYDAADVLTLSYNDVVSQARHDLEWLIRTLGR
jgi:hypothetical protein